VVPSLGANAEVDLIKRVAITLNYLAHGGTMHNAGSLFGAPKTVAQTAVHQIVAVLGTFVDETICSPSTQEAWIKVCRGIEGVAGMPGVVGAIDGSLIRIERFADFNIWYYRRGYPAFNMMSVVDHCQRFLAFSLRKAPRTTSRSSIERFLLGKCF